MKDVNVNQPLFFYDDRNKHDIDYRLTRIFYQGQGLCLCEAVPIVRPGSQLDEQLKEAKAGNGGAANDPVNEWWKRITPETILFNAVTGEVVSKDLDSWYATNDITIHGRYPDGANEAPALNRDIG